MRLKRFGGFQNLGQARTKYADIAWPAIQTSEQYEFASSLGAWKTLTINAVWHWRAPQKNQTAVDKMKLIKYSLLLQD